MNEPFPESPRHRILKLVGQGQFGRVFCAVHKPSGKLVALKELDQKRFPTHKFLRELHFLSSLQHSNIITLQGLEHTPTARYIVMDYCEGGNLRNLMQPEGQLSLVHGLKLMTDVLAGLEHAHSRGVIHCDLKPENILLSLDSTGWIARISDFGLARISHELRTEKNICTGSPAYMAPERFYGKYSPASDLYAVGVMLFELAVGYRPFSGLPGELMSAHLNRPVEIPNTVPFLLRSVISTAMQKLPNHRFACAAQMLKSIQLATEVEKLTSGSVPPLSVPSVDPSISALSSTQ
jgi:serine/threonine-protein kinase